MFYVIASSDRPGGWVSLSHANDWPAWIGGVLPMGLHVDVRQRLVSNLKHILVGLELKKALIVPHRQTAPGQNGVLFEPYYQSLIFEFAVGAFSVMEGIGAARWLDQQGLDGIDERRVRRDEWRPALCAAFDPDGQHGLDADVRSTSDVRDRLHQDQIGARVAIDWHAFGFEAAFVPAARAMATLLRSEEAAVPDATNLCHD